MHQFMSNIVKIYHNSKRNSKECMKQQPTFPIVDKVIVLQLKIPERPSLRHFDISSAWTLSSYSSRSKLYIPVAQKQLIAILHVNFRETRHGDLVYLDNKMFSFIMERHSCLQVAQHY